MAEIRFLYLFPPVRKEEFKSQVKNNLEGISRLSKTNLTGLVKFIVKNKDFISPYNDLISLKCHTYKLLALHCPLHTEPAWAACVSTKFANKVLAQAA